MNLVKGQVFNKLLIQTVKLQSVQNINKFKLTAVKLFIFKKFLHKVNSQFFHKLIQPLKFVSVCVAFSIQSLNEKEIIKIADDLHNQNKYDDQEKLLNKPELLERSNLKHEFKWRLARAKYYQIKEKKRNSSELENIRDLVLTALEDDPECGAAHKWASILIDAAAANIGIEERIKKLFTVKDHMLKAIHFSPKDPISLYILAEWHYSCYNVSWAERQIAKLIFGTLPEPDLEEALTCLKKAEEMQPCYYAKSLVLMSKTLIALKRESGLARQSLDKVLTNFQNSTKIDDIEAIKEAKEILKKMEKKGLPAFAKTAPIN